VTETVARLVGEVVDVAPALCRREWIGDWGDLDLLGADKADREVEPFLIGLGELRPGGFAGDSEFVFERERGTRCFDSTEEVGDLARGGIGGFSDAFVALLCVAEREWSICGGVADLVLNIVGRGSLISLN